MKIQHGRCKVTIWADILSTTGEGVEVRDDGCNRRRLRQKRYTLCISYLFDTGTKYLIYTP